MNVQAILHFCRSVWRNGCCSPTSFVADMFVYTL